jgi:hypothetical protein
MKLPAIGELRVFTNPSALAYSGRFVIVLSKGADLSPFPKQLTDDGLVIVKNGSISVFGDYFKCTWETQEFASPKTAVRYILGQDDELLWVNRELLGS